MKRFLFVLAALTLSALAAMPAAAQQAPGAEVAQVLVSRQALLDLAQQLEQTAQSSNFSSAVRDRARAQADKVRERLRDGDFQVGDRIMLRVEGETALSDTFTVRGGREVLLPNIGPIQLAGVLRSELNDYLTRQLAQYVRNPRVRAQALIRVAVIGAVRQQGYFTVPVDIPAWDVIQGAAGGMDGTAQIDKLKIERGTETLYEGDEVQQIMAQGRTLDQLGIQAGDRFELPAQQQRNRFQSVQTIQILLTIPLTIFGLVRLFKGL